MGSAAGWLSLKIIDRRTPPPGGTARPLSPRYRLLISVPKKSVRLATQRNRIKRLIREAVRLDGLFGEADRTYLLKVQRDPGGIGLDQTRQQLHALTAR